MRSPDTDEILRRINAVLPKLAPANPPPEPQRPRDVGKLKEDLQYLLDAVGKERYAQATARLFAPGGKYNRPAKRLRYAIT